MAIFLYVVEEPAHRRDWFRRGGNLVWEAYPFPYDSRRVDLSLDCVEAGELLGISAC